MGKETMNERNDEFIYEGKRYRYDPDYDTFRRVDDDPETKLSKYGWILLVVIIALIPLWLS
jgi:hypothetical protein